MWPQETMAKLEKLIPRLSSDQDGEIVSTVRAIERTLKSANLDWHDFTAKALSRHQKNYGEKPQGQQPKSEWARKVEFCLRFKEYFSDREFEFLNDINAKLRYVSELTPRQAAWLEALYQRAFRRRGGSS